MGTVRRKISHTHAGPLRGAVQPFLLLCVYSVCERESGKYGFSHRLRRWVFFIASRFCLKYTNGMLFLHIRTFLNATSSWRGIYFLSILNPPLGALRTWHSRLTDMKAAPHSACLLLHFPQRSLSLLFSTFPGHVGWQQRMLMVPTIHFLLEN